MAVDTIRAKQNAEILDVYKDINRQVVALTRKQVQAFPQSLKPKTQRDLGAEVNVDKGIEALNKTLETKLAALEFAVQHFSREIDEGLFAEGRYARDFNAAYGTVINTGDVIPLWNQLARLYRTNGLSRESQQIIKTKLLDIKPNLEALQYGLTAAVDFIFEHKLVYGEPPPDTGIAAMRRLERRGDLSASAEEEPRPLSTNSALALRVLELLRTLSIYKTVLSEVDGEPRPLSVADLDAAYKNVFQSLSQQEIEILKQVAPRGDIMTQSIRNIPDFNTQDTAGRLKAIEEELGFRIPPDQLSWLRKLPRDKLNEAIDKFRSEKKGYLEGFSTQQKRLIIEIQKIAARRQELLGKIITTYREIDEIEETIEQVTSGEIYDEAAGGLEEIPEAPLEPVRPKIEDFVAGDPEDIPEDDFVERVEAYQQAVADYEEQMHADLLLRVRRAAAVRRNRILEQIHRTQVAEAVDRGAISREAAQELLDNLQREKELLEHDLETLDTQVQDVDAQKAAYEFEVGQLLDRGELDRRLQVILGAELGAIPERSLHDDVQAALDEIEREPKYSGEGKHKGKPVDTRGLASMRLNYGAEDDSSSSDSGSESSSDEEDALDFDDTRNEHYYTKPHKR